MLFIRSFAFEKRNMMSRFLPYILFVALLFVAVGCKSPIERRREAALLDSLRRDSARPVNNPYKYGQGTQMYNQERENLGNIDSLVTPQQPAIPNR
jgi:hypothetical protein